jgi:Ca2+/H+ antiporter, TMEM165/GDT1 family
VLRDGSVLLGVTLAFLLAEFGDKTMLATVTLATTQSPLATWLGAGAGMTAASAFLLFGLLLLYQGLRG